MSSRKHHDNIVHIVAIDDFEQDNTIHTSSKQKLINQLFFQNPGSCDRS